MFKKVWTDIRVRTNVVTALAMILWATASLLFAHLVTALVWARGNVLTVSRDLDAMLMLFIPAFLFFLTIFLLWIVDYFLGLIDLFKKEDGGTPLEILLMVSLVAFWAAMSISALYGLMDLWRLGRSMTWSQIADGIFFVFLSLGFLLATIWLGVKLGLPFRNPFSKWR